MVITHNPNNPEIIGKIRDNFINLTNSRRMKNILDKKIDC